MSIREVGQSGERKNPRGRRKKRKMARAGRLGAGLKHHLGAIDLGAVLSANNHGAKLGAKIYGAELGASHSGAEPLAGHLPVPMTSVPVTVAPSSAPVTLAPNQGFISGILSARSLFERNFRKKGQKVKNSADPA